MAKLNAPFGFTGPIGNLSAYTMKGVEGIVIRQKGGASKDVIKQSPRFKNTRAANAEFGGRSKAGCGVRRALHQQLFMADYNVSGPINALMKPAQEQDSGNPFGRRSVLLSKCAGLLDGFSFNRDTPLDTIVRTPFAYTLSRETLSAHVSVPSLRPGVNFNTKEKYPYYGFVVSLGIAPDLFWNGSEYTPSPLVNTDGREVVVQTAWYPVLQGSPALELDIRHTVTPADQSFMLILSVGLCFGTTRDGNSTEWVFGTGAAKILASA